MAMSPDGRFIASGDGSGRVRVWDQAEQREVPSDGAPPHIQRITSLAFFPSKGEFRLVSLDQDGQEQALGHDRPGVEERAAAWRSTWSACRGAPGRAGGASPWRIRRGKSA